MDLLSREIAPVLGDCPTILAKDVKNDNVVYFNKSQAWCYIIRRCDCGRTFSNISMKSVLQHVQGSPSCRKTQKWDFDTLAQRLGITVLRADYT
jgi:hypothetical protein